MNGQSTDFYAACRALLAIPNADAYAKAYAKEGMRIGAEDCEAIRVQSLYILSNMSHMRGDEARHVRDVFKRYAR